MGAVVSRPHGPPDEVVLHWADASAPMRCLLLLVVAALVWAGWYVLSRPRCDGHEEGIVFTPWDELTEEEREDGI